MNKIYTVYDVCFLLIAIVLYLTYNKIKKIEEKLGIK